MRLFVSFTISAAVLCPVLADDPPRKSERAEVVKFFKDHVVGKSFDTRREADAWLSRERAALAGGIRVGKGKRITHDIRIAHT